MRSQDHRTSSIVGLDALKEASRVARELWRDSSFALGAGQDEWRSPIRENFARGRRWRLWRQIAPGCGTAITSQLKAARPAIPGGVHRCCGAGYCDIVKCGDRQSPSIGNHDLTSSMVAGTRWLQNHIGHAGRINAKNRRLESAKYEGRGWHVGLHRNPKCVIHHKPAGEDGRRRRGPWGGRRSQHRAGKCRLNSETLIRHSCSTPHERQIWERRTDWRQAQPRRFFL